MSNLTKVEAIRALCKGQKVAHQHFTPDEWMEQDGHYYVF